LNEDFRFGQDRQPREKPTGFAYELCLTDKLVARQDQLILELKPVCNQKLG
jgi:hypothetical protein